MNFVRLRYTVILPAVPYLFRAPSARLLPFILRFPREQTRKRATGDHNEL